MSTCLGRAYFALPKMYPNGHIKDHLASTVSLFSRFDNVLPSHIDQKCIHSQENVKMSPKLVDLCATNEARTMNKVDEFSQMLLFRMFVQC